MNVYWYLLIKHSWTNNILQWYLLADKFCDGWDIFRFYLIIIAIILYTYKPSIFILFLICWLEAVHSFSSWFITPSFTQKYCQFFKSHVFLKFDLFLSSFLTEVCLCPWLSLLPYLYAYSILCLKDKLYLYCFYLYWICVCVCACIYNFYGVEKVVCWSLNL